MGVVREWAKTHPSFAGLDVSVEVILGPAEQVSRSLPLAEFCDSSANIRGGGRWHSWRVWARQLHTGQVAVSFEVSVSQPGRDRKSVMLE